MNSEMMIVVLVTGAISALVAFFFTNISKRRGIEKLEKRQDDFEKATNKKIEENAKEIVKKIDEVKKMYQEQHKDFELSVGGKLALLEKSYHSVSASLVFVVTKLGGDPSKMGLM